MEILILLALSLFFNIIFFLKFDDISKIFNIIDKPDGKLKRHKEKVSLLGGFIIISNLYLIIFLCYFLDIQNLIFEENFIYIILILSSVFFSIGIIDDLKSLNPNLKLTLIIISIALISFLFPDINLKVVKISFLEKNYYFNNFSYFFIILSYALLLNAFNMFDGINLQLILFCSFIFCLFIFKGFVPFFFTLMLIPMIILGILNFRNKIFLGDSGSYLLGGMIGTSFIYQYKNFENFFYGDEIFLILFVPAIDMLRLFILRLFNKKNPFKGDLNHLHHLVNNFTNNQNKTIILTLILCIIPATLLIFKLNSIFVLIINLIIYISLIFYLRYKK
tara:strand:+ start:10868 stop:11869 length:1002 start_codon:yes stop_codon:yes gene_type:complete